MLRVNWFRAGWIAWVVAITFTFVPKGADPPIIHQITLPRGDSWCDDSRIYGELKYVNIYRATNGFGPLAVDTLGIVSRNINC